MKKISSYLLPGFFGILLGFLLITALQVGRFLQLTETERVQGSGQTRISNVEQIFHIGATGTKYKINGNCTGDNQDCNIFVQNDFISDIPNSITSSTTNKLEFSTSTLFAIKLYPQMATMTLPAIPLGRAKSIAFNFNWVASTSGASIAWQYEVSNNANLSNNNSGDWYGINTLPAVYSNTNWDDSASSPSSQGYGQTRGSSTINSLRIAPLTALNRQFTLDRGKDFIGRFIRLNLIGNGATSSLNIETVLQNPD